MCFLWVLGSGDSFWFWGFWGFPWVFGPAYTCTYTYHIPHTHARTALAAGASSYSHWMGHTSRSGTNLLSAVISEKGREDREREREGETHAHTHTHTHTHRCTHAAMHSSSISSASHPSRRLFPTTSAMPMKSSAVGWCEYTQALISRAVRSGGSRPVQANKRRL